MLKPISFARRFLIAQFPSHSYNLRVLQGFPSTCLLDIIVVVPAVLFCMVFFMAKFLTTRRTFLPPRWIKIVYFVLVVASLCMSILEVARLFADKLGPGLLLINTFALLLVLVLLVDERHARSRSLAVVRVPNPQRYRHTHESILYL